MIRLLRLFAILGVIALAAAWLADNPGSLKLDWRGYRIESSFALLPGRRLPLCAAARAIMDLWLVARGARAAGPAEQRA